jgi:hypothetical protein
MTCWKRKGLRLLLLAFILMSAWLHPVAGQTPAVSARIDSPSVLIGDQFHLLLEARTDPSVKINWPSIPDTFDHIQVLTRGKIDTLAGGGQTVYTQRITLTSFDSGLWKVPALIFRVPGGDSSEQLMTDSLFEAVNTVPVDTTQPFRPIRPIHGVPFDIRDYLLYILLGAVTALVLAGLIVWLVKRKRPAGPPAPPPPREKPDEAALKALYSLQSEKLWQRGEVKLYYVRLTDIIRTYLEQQFTIPAMELTTEELMDNIRSVTIVSQQKEALNDILFTADLVKFAKMQPFSEDHIRCMQKAVDLVEWTRPKSGAPAN